MVTQRWNRHQNKSHTERIDPGEENCPATAAGTQTHNLFILSPLNYPRSLRSIKLLWIINTAECKAMEEHTSSHPVSKHSKHPISHSTAPNTSQSMPITSQSVLNISQRNTQYLTVSAQYFTAQHPVPHSQCPIPHSQCSIPNSTAPNTSQSVPNTS